MKKLDLSHNEFSEKGGQLLGQKLSSLIINPAKPGVQALRDWLQHSEHTFPSPAKMSHDLGVQYKR